MSTNVKLGGAKMSGVQKAAILLLSVSDEVAANIFKKLNDEEVKEISHAMSSLGVISPHLVDTVVQDFGDDIFNNSIFLGNLHTTARLLGKIMEPDKVKSLLEDIRGPQGRDTWEKLGNVSEELLALYLQNEQPQTVALVLSKLPPEHAAKVLAQLPEKLAFDAIVRVLNMGVVKKEVIEGVEKILRAEFISTIGKTMKRDSCEMIADILYNMDRASEAKYLTMLESSAPESAQRVKDLMFTFEDLAKLDDKGMQVVIRTVDKAKLTIALKGASDKIKELFFKNMSQRAARIVVEELESMGPVKVRDVDEAQSAIIKTVKDLIEKGEVATLADGKEEYI